MYTQQCIIDHSFFFIFPGKLSSFCSDWWEAEQDSITLHELVHQQQSTITAAGVGAERHRRSFKAQTKDSLMQ